MPSRFYCADLTGSTAELEAGEAHHAAHVMRVQPGEPLELFDGAGGTATGLVEQVSRRRVVIRISSRTEADDTWSPSLTVAASPPKGDRLKWMIEKLTELGVDRYLPLLTERAVVIPRETKLDRLKATVIGACKQSGRNRLMELLPACRLSDLLPVWSEQYDQLVVAHPRMSQQAVAGRGTAAHGHSLLLIGPEGGFSDDEVSAMQQHGAQFVSRDGHVLRTETAALVFAAALGRPCSE